MVVHCASFRTKSSCESGRKDADGMLTKQSHCVPGDHDSHDLVPGHRRYRRYRHARALPEARVFVDPVAYVQNELRRGAGNSLAMRHVVERPLQFGMLRDVLADLVELLPVDFRHCSNSVLAFTLASPSAICTRL